MRSCWGWLAGLVLVSIASSCCTRELALSVGDAARESFFREQDRVQQRFLQIEADSIKDTVSTVQNVLQDEKTREAIRKLAEDFTKTTDKNLEATAKRLEKTLARVDQSLEETFKSMDKNLTTTLGHVDKSLNGTLQRMDDQLDKSVRRLGETLRSEQQKLQKVTVTAVETVSQTASKNFKEMSEKLGTTLTDTVETSVDKTRSILSKKDLIPKQARDQVRETVQPLINEIIQESGKQTRDTVQKNIDQLSYPLALGSIVMVAFALLTMVLPSLFLFMSYKRSIAALAMLKDISKERADPSSPEGSS